MRYLSIDLGDKRTGLAVGDDETKHVSPVEVLEIPRGERLVEALLKSVNRHEPQAIVIGLPMNMDGTEGPAARTVREFGAMVQQRSGMPVHFQDERLTTYAADQQMSQSGRTHRQKKQLRDALAAVEILRDFIHRHAGSDQSEGPNLKR